jgi:hypothetical protein
LQLVSKYQLDAKKFHPIGMMPSTLMKSASINSISSGSSMQKAKGNELLKRSFKPGDIPPAQCPPDVPSSGFRKAIDVLLASLSLITKGYIENDAPKQVCLSALIRKTVLNHVEKGVCHPDILTPPYEHVIETLRTTQFDTFVRRKSEENRLNSILEAMIPKYTLSQLLNNEVPPPYSKDGKT